MSFQIRKIVVSSETLYMEAGRSVDPPITRTAVAAVVINPCVGEYHNDLSGMSEAAEELGQRLSAKSVQWLRGEPHSYGKAAIVGLGGELEHAAAVLHPTLGKPMRAAVGGGSAIIPSTKKVGPAGTGIDVPLHYKDAAFVRSHFDAMEVRISDAPRDNEIVIIVATTDGGRPHPRVGGLSRSDAIGEDGLR